MCANRHGAVSSDSTTIDLGDITEWRIVPVERLVLFARHSCNYSIICNWSIHIAHYTRVAAAYDYTYTLTSFAFDMFELSWLFKILRSIREIHQLDLTKDDDRVAGPTESPSQLHRVDHFGIASCHLSTSGEMIWTHRPLFTSDIYCIALPMFLTFSSRTYICIIDVCIIMMAILRERNSTSPRLYHEFNLNHKQTWQPWTLRTLGL